MKINRLVFGLFLALSIVSCKDNKETKEEGKAEATELAPTYDVSFTLVVPKDDVLQLFYTEDGSIVFGDDRSVRSVVKGSEAPQEVIFKLPENVLPTNIRLDFGDSPEQGNIVIKSMKFTYTGKIYQKIFGPNEQISHYFYPQESQIKINDATSTIELLKPKGQPHDPLMWSNELLSEEMVKLYKK